jgi:hypothetical protein
MGGVDLLIELLADIAYDRPIVVIGERDQKENGHWPGMEGAIRTAQRLTDELERPVGWALPPDDAKDARAWLLKMPALPKDRLAALFLDGLDTTVFEPPPRFRQPVNQSPAIPVDGWREWMLRVRNESVRKAGYYLDDSATGAGKSTIDHSVIVQHVYAEAA